MAVDPHKRQRKLERRKAKEKTRKKAMAERPRELVARLERSTTAPILHCCTNRSHLEQGLAYTLLSRELKSGNVAFALFLIDRYCLGVKNAMYGIAPRSRYDFQIYGKLFLDRPTVAMKPEAMRKLVEGAAEYAANLGFSPHRDYAKAKLIFGDIDAGSCTEEFEYGKDGKPFFVAGPYDDSLRCSQILAILANRCGPKEYQYMIPTEGGAPVAVLEEDDEIGNVLRFIEVD